MKEKTTAGTNIRRAIIAAGILGPTIVVGKSWLNNAMMQRSLVGKTVGVIGAMGCAAITGYEAYVWVPQIYDAASEKLRNHVEISITRPSQDEV